MPSQVLVNVVTVTALAGGAAVALPHGLVQRGKLLTPTLVYPDRNTPIVVEAVSNTTITFRNTSGAPATARFRAEYGLSIEVNHTILPTMYWQGGAGAAGGVNSLGVTTPVVNTGTATDPIIGLIAPGTAGNVLTSNGTNWVSGVPAGVSVYRTIYVAKNGNDVTGDGSLSKPYLTIGAALTAANAIASTEYVVISVGPGTYTEFVNITRRRTALLGAGCTVGSPVTQINGFIVQPSGGTSVDTDTVYIRGFYANGTSNTALRITGLAASTTCGVVVENCVLSSNFTNSTVQEDAGGASPPLAITIRDSIITAGSAANTPPYILGTYNSNFTIENCTIAHDSTVPLNAAGIGGIRVWLGASMTIRSSTIRCRGANYAIVCEGSAPASNYKLSMFDSAVYSLATTSGGGISFASGTLQGLIYRTFWQVTSNTAGVYLIGGTGTIYYGGWSTQYQSNTSVQGGILRSAQELLGNLLLPSLGIGALTKDTTTGAVTSVSPGPLGNVLASDGSKWISTGNLPSGLVLAPAGASTFTAGKVVAVNDSGDLALADNVSIATAPVAGLYVSGGYIRVAGEQTGLSGLVKGQLYYLGTNGDLVISPPTSPGNIVQCIGRATSTTSLFVSLATIVVV